MKMKAKTIVTLVVSRQNSSSLVHAGRTTAAAVASLLVARLLRMPEAYWASITALIVMQSTFGLSLSISAERFVGTAVGAALGAVAAAYFHSNVAVFGTLVFLIGLLCTVLHVDRTAYRFASVTLAIIMLIPRADSPWAVALHRFVEVSIGIVVALAIAAVWPEHHSVTRTISPAVAPGTAGS